MLARMRRWAIFGMVTAAPSIAAAQASEPKPPATYRVAGVVADRDGRLVPDAEVSLTEHGAAARVAHSDSSGKFSFSELTSPDLILHVRRLGFQPQQLAVHVTKAGRTANVSVTLEPNIATLDAVVVDDEAPRDPPNPRLVGFKERLATNSFGHFVTQEMLTNQRPRFASDAIRTLPGVTTRPGAFGSIVRLRGCGMRGQSAEKVGPLVWLDGVRLAGAEIDEVTDASNIAAIEVYNSFAGVPAQYLDRSAVCGTILVWTKTR
jgi:hypothetical protein